MPQIWLRIRPLADLYVIVTIVSALFIAGSFILYTLPRLLGRPDVLFESVDIFFNFGMPLARALAQIVLALLIRAVAYLFADLCETLFARSSKA